jgi:hypothetical protein
MNLSRDSMLALQRHFLGALSAPARTWLEPLPSTPLVFIGNALRFDGEGCVLDFGSAASPGEERRRVRVCNRGPARIDVCVTDVPSWLRVRWVHSDGDTVLLASGDAGATLELIAAHDAEHEFRGALGLRVGSHIETLRVQLITRRSHPFATIDFNGASTPGTFDFGAEERPYTLTIRNATSVPLVVAFADLPARLTFEVDGHRRGGPMAGPFFERTAPFTVTLRPQSLGPHSGVLRLRTNDARPELQSIELAFTACLLAAKPRVRVISPPRMRMRADQTLTAEAQLENWGRAVARTSKEVVPRALGIRICPTIPAAHDQQPGRVPLTMRVAPAHLAPGAHTLSLSLRIEGGDPARIDVPVYIDVTPRRKPVLRPETIAALFALLLLTLLFVIARGLS